MEIMKYKKKPVVIEAIQWNGNNIHDIYEFTGNKAMLSTNSIYRPQGHLPKDYNLYIETLEGLMKANVGDYIIKGINGEFYPCKQFIFLETYELVEE